MSLIPIKIKTAENGHTFSEDGFYDDVSGQLTRKFSGGRIVEVRQLGFVETLYEQFVEPEPQQQKQ